MSRSILEDYAQAIVETTHSIIGYDILITDNRGVIIGTNDPPRMGTMHAHSLRVIARGVPETADGDSAREFGVREGVCIPIRLGTEIMGTAAIAGNPEEVRKYGHLVQKEAELFLRMKLMQESTQLRESAVANLIGQLTTFDPKYMNDSFLRSQAKSLGYKLDIPRSVVLVDIACFGGIVDSIFAEECYVHDAELRVQTVKTRILIQLRDVFNDPQDIVSNIGADKYLILAAISGFSDSERRARLREKADRASEALRGRKFAASIGIGFPAPAVDGLMLSFRSAWRAISIGKKLGRGVCVHEAEALQLEDLLLSLNQDTAKRYIDKSLGRFFSHPQWDEELEATLRAWLSAPFHPGEVAQKLGIHRNTLAYRIDKINELGGVDLKKPEDVFHLKVSLLLRDLIFGMTSKEFTEVPLAPN